MDTGKQAAAYTYNAHHSTTPPLHHSTTPPLHHSTTPPLHHSLTTPPLSLIQLNGWATTINWKRVLQPAFANAVSDFRRRAEASRNSIVSSSSTSGGSGSSAASSSSGRSATEPYCTRALGRSRFAAALHGRAPRVLSGRCSVHGRYARPHSPQHAQQHCHPTLTTLPSPAAHTGAARARLLADRAERAASLPEGTHHVCRGQRFFPDSLPPPLERLTS